MYFICCVILKGRNKQNAASLTEIQFNKFPMPVTQTNEFKPPEAFLGTIVDEQS